MKTLVRLFVFLMLCGALGVASASPITYRFTFIDADSGLVDGAGTFTTDGAAALSGYFLLTDLTFTALRGFNSGLNTGSASTSSFQPDASFNPTNLRFHARDGIGGPNLNNFGGATVTGQLGAFTSALIFPQSFAAENRSLIARLYIGTNQVDNFATDSTPALLITVQAVSVPEPASMALLLAGVGALTLSRRRSRRSDEDDGRDETQGRGE